MRLKLARSNYFEEWIAGLFCGVYEGELRLPISMIDNLS